jgi:hypothetical protein
MKLLTQLAVSGKRQAIYCHPKAELAVARRAGWLAESKDIFGYKVVELSTEGLAYVANHLNEEIASAWGAVAVTPDGTPWTTPEIPPRIRGHVLNWLTFAGKGGPPPAKANGKAYCVEQGWINEHDELTRQGRRVYHCLTRVPMWSYGGKVTTLAELCIHPPTPGRPSTNDPRASLVARIKELEERVAHLEASR